MEKIDFIAGNEKRFGEFVSKLGKEKIALICHISDLDGVASAKIANSVLNADLLKFLDYYELTDSLVDELKKAKVKQVVFADMFIKTSDIIRKIEKFADVMIIDHHVMNEDYNSDKTVFINAQGYCAAYICYYLFSKVQNLEKFDWLAACASVSDWMFFKNTEFMNKIYGKYGDKFVGDEDGIKRGKKFWELQNKLSLAIVYFRESGVKKVYDSIGEGFGNIGDLGKYSDEVQREVDEGVEKFDREKKEVFDGYLWETYEPKYPVKSIIVNEISHKIKNRTILIAMKDEKKGIYRLSSRRQDKKYDMNKMMMTLTQGLKDAAGGGHFAAAGGSVLISDYEEFKKRLLNYKFI